MRYLFPLVSLPLLGILGTTMSVNVSQCGGDDDDTNYSSRLLVGSATITILPEVEGSTSYFDALRDQEPLAIPAGDTGRDPGVFVNEWDVGTLAIGNGNPSSHWVHDEIRAGVMAFRELDQADGKTIVMVGVDVYMLFRQDIEEIYDKVRADVGNDRFDDLVILVGASHTHMGPDTSGMVRMNHQYYFYMTDQIATAILQAIDEDNMRPAHVKLASTSHQFGLSDATPPYVIDPTFNILQAVSSDDGSVIGTLMQWQNHPETTLGYGEDIYATDEQADYLKSINECFLADDGEHCHIEGQYISAGFPGYAVWRMMEETGAPAVYFNGPVGAMQTPLRATIWETEGDNGMPVGNGVDIPEGATIIPKSFHKLAVIGNELGKKALEALTTAELVTEAPVFHQSAEIYSRLVNWGFRIGLVVKANGQPLVLGHLKRELYNCPAAGPRNAETCVSDNFESQNDPIFGVPVRVGDVGKTEIHYVKIGPSGFMTIPAETVVEVMEGLPSDFYDDPRGIYYKSDAEKNDHAVGTTYDTNGYVRQTMDDRYKFALGLTQDELGYMFPISNWRIFCIADEEEFGGVAGNCATLKDAGIIDYAGSSGDNWSISGSRCKSIYDSPDVLQSSPYTDVPGGAEWAYQSCYYGQAFDEADDHYEETNSAGWDMEADYIQGIKNLTGWTGEMSDVNPEFIGYTQ